MITVKTPADPRQDKPASPEYGPEVHEPVDDAGAEEVTIPTRNVRQGVEHHHVRTILAVSLAAVLVLMALAYFFYF